MRLHESKRRATSAAVVGAMALVGVLVHAQAQDPGAPRRQDAAAGRGPLFSPDDAVILLLDHQTGLFQTVRDIRIDELRANTVVLAKIGELAGAPILTTASEPDGPNGPLMAELEQAAPNATFIRRKGEISAWDNADFKAAVEATGRRTLIMAGVWTGVCVAFPALQARAEGYQVYAVMDASGDMSEQASEAARERMTQAGVVPITVNGVLCEFQRTWARPDAAAWGALYQELVPAYRAAAESYQRAQEAATGRGAK